MEFTMTTETINRPFGTKLAELGGKHPNLIFLDADLQRVTESDEFSRLYPTRHFNVGIAEGNMVAIASGMALSGKIAFCGTFATFITQRACDQVVQCAAYCGANVKMCGFESGLSSGGNGASHQAVMDLALMRSIPGMSVYDPGDAQELSEVMDYLANSDGPAYLRAPRKSYPVLYKHEKNHFEPGKAICLRNGKDVTIIACGIMLARAIEAADSLAGEGIDVRLLSMPSIKPLDAEAIYQAAHETGCIVTVENHSILGGLGSAVTEVVCEVHPVPVIRIGMRDCFGEVGTLDWLADKFEMNATAIKKAVNRVLEKKHTVL
jgi:transketolase